MTMEEFASRYGCSGFPARIREYVRLNPDPEFADEMLRIATHLETAMMDYLGIRPIK